MKTNPKTPKLRETIVKATPATKKTANAGENIRHIEAMPSPGGSPVNEARSFLMSGGGCPKYRAI